MSAAFPADIMVVPFHGQGHLFPSAELCLHLAARNFTITLLVPSSLLSSLPSSLRNHPLIQVAHISPTPPPPPSPPPHPSLSQAPDRSDDDDDQAFASFLAQRRNSPPSCVIVDVMMSRVADVCRRFDIPVVIFFTSGACSAAMEHALWKVVSHNGLDSRPPTTAAKKITLTLPGLPEDLSLTLEDLPSDRPPPYNQPTHPSPPPPHSHNRRGGGPSPPPGPPPRPGGRPPWLSCTEGSVAVLMNTSQDLERPFLDYVGQKIQKPVWGVGPLLPAQFWRPSEGGLLHDREIRSDRDSNMSEDAISSWLDSKPAGSVVYVAFGTEVGPSKSELQELAAALEESNRFFVWALRRSMGGPPPGPPPQIPGPGDFEMEKDGGDEELSPEGLRERVGGRGLIVEGWAPQLMILSHPSTGVFITHVGWNSTAEALGRGVPMLCWPIRGDQHYNAKLVAAHLKVGHMVRPADGSAPVKKEDILRGMDKLLDDHEARERAAELRLSFSHGFPAISSASLDAFRDLISRKTSD